MSKKLEAKVKAGYNMGSVVAFSGHEYTLHDWREVPAGFEPAAIAHPLLDVRDAETQEEIKVTAKDHLAEMIDPPVSVETPEEEKPAPSRKTRRSKKEE